MNTYFLGIDIGASKSHALVTDENGQAVGFGEAGPGNYESVGWDGYRHALQQVTKRAVDSAGIDQDQIIAAGFGVGGYDWPVERQPILEGIATLGLNCPVEAVNDTIIGLIAGAREGWGIVLVSGTSNNCRGRDKKGREAQITGNAFKFGEYGGANEISWKAIHAVSYDWSSRGPKTALTDAFIHYTGARNSTDLIEGLQFERYRIGAEVAPLVFDVADAGDPVAREIITWAGNELAASARGIIRQLEFVELEFEVVLVGSTFKGGSMILDPMEAGIRDIAPGAQFLCLKTPPVVGAVLLAMEQVGLDLEHIRPGLIESTNKLLKKK
jgi:N-acetylglucosamine kinase-like BadF-type ATPase